MSRSNPEENAINPCSNWFQWDGGDGKGLKKYNKETKKNDIIPIPFKFLVLDRLVTVIGYNEPEKIGYYANEIRNMKNDKLTVRSKNGIEAEGTYEEVKAKLGTKGLNFAQSCYIAYFEGKDLTLGNIKMTGAALENWFNFCKVNKIDEIGIILKEAKEAKKGKVIYYEPIFESMKIKDETNAAAIELDKELQEYLKAYLERNQTSTEAVKHENKTEGSQEEKTKQEAHKYPDHPETNSADINLDDDGLDLPF